MSPCAAPRVLQHTPDLHCVGAVHHSMAASNETKSARKCRLIEKMVPAAAARLKAAPPQAGRRRSAGCTPLGRRQRCRSRCQTGAEPPGAAAVARDYWRPLAAELPPAFSTAPCINRPSSMCCMLLIVPAGAHRDFGAHDDRTCATLRSFLAVRDSSFTSGYASCNAVTRCLHIRNVHQITHHAG